MTEAVAILGPTAVGKSDLGLRLAERFDGEIVSADALQIYRGFDIGTAKPPREVRRRVPHHLLDILSPEEAFSAGEFARRAGRVLEEIQGRGRVALILGGSGLYLRALLDGISPIPPIECRVREQVQDRLVRSGLEPLRRQLEAVDPVTAARLGRGDTQRITRALEVVLSTGKPLSVWLEEDPSGRGPIQALRIGLTLPRAVLYDRISVRVRRMIRDGWVDEVRDLLRRGLSVELPAFQAIGYRQLAAHVRGELSLEEAVASTARATCRYAKRQLTWFRKQEGVTWFSAEDREALHSEVCEFLKSKGLGGGNAKDQHQHSGRFSLPEP